MAGRDVEVDWESCDAERVRANSGVMWPFSGMAGEEEGEW